MRTYKKPMITVDSGLAEGVYAASGSSQGILNVTYHGVWDRWGTNGGIHLNHGTSIDDLQMTGFTYSVN